MVTVLFSGPSYNSSQNPKTRIPYEKGFSLLWYLQTIFGDEKFEGYLKGTKSISFNSDVKIITS